MEIPMFSPGDRVRLDFGPDIYYISTLESSSPNMYHLCDRDGTYKFEVDPSRLTLVITGEDEASESEDDSEADKSSEEENTKQERKGRKYVASSESENPMENVI